MPSTLYLQSNDLLHVQKSKAVEFFLTEGRDLLIYQARIASRTRTLTDLHRAVRTEITMFGRTS